MILFDNLPLWTAWPILLAILLLAAGLGFRSFAWLARKADASIEGPGPDTLLGATLGLLALLLGFTFSLAMQRNEDRRDLVIQEANAVTTSWLRIQALDEPGRAQVANLFRQYVDARIDWSNVEDDRGMSAALARSDRVRAALWPAATAALRTSPGVNDSDSMLNPLNAAFDAAASRVALRADRLPEHIVNLMLLYTIISAALIGWRLGGAGQRYRVATFLTLLLLTLAITAIVDLDRPRSGNIMISQKPLVDARAQMR